MDGGIGARGAGRSEQAVMMIARVRCDLLPVFDERAGHLIGLGFFRSDRSSIGWWDRDRCGQDAKTGSLRDLHRLGVIILLPFSHSHTC